MEKRYIKNMNMLSEDEIKSLHKAKICVIGCGGLGGFVIEGLIRLGFENLTVVDNDVFDKSNLNRQLFATESTLQNSKARTAGERVVDINSRSKVNPITLRFDRKYGKKIIQNHDIVIDAVDNVETKLLLEEFCNELNIPLIHGAIGGWFGQVAIIHPGDGILSKIYSSNTDGIEKELGNPSFTPAVTANIMVAEALKLYLNKKEKLHKQLLVIDLLNHSYDVIDIK
ncbi:HesA/MoeB/ThiF family protein [Mycoplasmatota bacterium WC44]